MQCNVLSSSFNCLATLEPFSVDRIAFNTREVAAVTAMLHKQGNEDKGQRVSLCVGKIRGQSLEHLYSRTGQTYRTAVVTAKGVESHSVHDEAVPHTTRPYTRSLPDISRCTVLLRRPYLDRRHGDQRRRPVVSWPLQAASESP